MSWHLRQLEHLLALADTGSFSRAAERLHLTQSALSRSIQLLEEDFGARLIDRLGKRNELTPLGHLVAERARRVLFETGELRRTAEQFLEGQVGTLRVGLGSGPGAMVMTPFLTHAALHHPGLRVVITRGSIGLQLQQLRQRVLDALLVDVRSVPPAPDLLFEPAAELEAGFVCRSGHPLLALGRRVRFDELLAYPLASTPLADEVARLMVERYGPQADPQAAVRLRCEEVHSLIDVVRASDAIFLGILAAAGPSLASGELGVLVTEPPLDAKARFAYVTLHGRTEAPPMALFRAFVAQTLRDPE